MKVKTLKIHAGNEYKDKLEKILKENNFQYKIQNKKERDVNKNLESIFWNGTEFKWEKQINTSYEVKICNDDDKNLILKIFNLEKYPTRNYIHYHFNKTEYEKYDYKYTKEYKNKYPIYILSKGRWEKTITADELDEMKVDYKIVVEPKEYDNYVKKINKNKILKLPENFSEQGSGGIPTRNWIWQHAVDNGHKKHWIVDDNIAGFYRWHYNTLKKIKNPVYFSILENYIDQFENVYLSAPQSFCFIPKNSRQHKGIVVNSRCYSCILIDHRLDDILEERWRGRYNEDTDLTLRVLSKGYCTLLFQNYVMDKLPSGTIKGGNTDTIYDGGSHKGYQAKYDELKNNWPDIVKLKKNSHKDGRPHHQISYTKLFKQELKLKDGVSYEGFNEYGILFEKQDELEEITKKVEEIKIEEIKDKEKICKECGEIEKGDYCDCYDED